MVCNLGEALTQPSFSVQTEDALIIHIQCCKSCRSSPNQLHRSQHTVELEYEVVHFAASMLCQLVHQVVRLQHGFRLDGLPSRTVA